MELGKINNNILIVDDEIEITKSLNRELRKKFNVFVANSGEEAYDILKQNEICVIISDQRMPKMTGIEFFSKIKNEFPDAIRIILTGFTDIEAAINAINEGQIFRYIKKPWNPLDLELIINEALESYNLIFENRYLLKELKNVNEILLEKNEELTNIKKKLEESDALKTKFLRNISHKIRTPMNAIYGFTSVLNKPELTEDKRKTFISIIQSNSNQLLSTVTDIITISSLETNQEKVKISKVCTNNIILELLSVFKPQTDIYNLNIFAKQNLSDKQSEIYTDKLKLTQILTYILKNAVKYTEKGFVEFGYNLKDIDENNSILEFYVKDTGVGIAAEYNEKIFVDFFQIENSINKNYTGTGLGLSIAKKLADIIEGKITLESELDKGTTFYLSIPYNPVHKEFETKNKQKTKVTTILIAEDEEFNFLFIELMLIDFDVKLIHAKDGLETVDVCKANPEIDIILMDIKMPNLNGYEAAKIIRESHPNLPIIAQTAYALEAEFEIYKDAFDDYITKPLKEEELKQKLLKFAVFNNEN